MILHVTYIDTLLHFRIKPHKPGLAEANLGFLHASWLGFLHSAHG